MTNEEMKQRLLEASSKLMAASSSRTRFSIENLVEMRALRDEARDLGASKELLSELDAILNHFSDKFEKRRELA